MVIFDLNYQTMITKLDDLDLNGSYSYADYLTWQLSETIELIKGRVFPMSPAPRTMHQRIVGRFFGHLDKHLADSSGGCEAFIAPFDVRLPKPGQHRDQEIYTVVQPDLCVYCDPAKVDERGGVGAPDLVIEILSKGSIKHDKTVKRELYEEAGVKELWLVYQNEEIVEVFLLANGQYGKLAVFENGEPLTSPQFTGLAIDLAQIFYRP
jgi:Uma2 family endonuclease